MCPRRGNRTSLLSQAHHVDVFACGEERKQPSCYDDRSGIVCSCHFYWWLPCLSPGFDWLMQISFPFPFFMCDRAQDYPCPSTHSLPISALGHCHLSVSVCLCRFFFFFFSSHLAFGWWNCCSCVLTRTVPSHQASVMETVSVARSHLSLTHKSPYTHMCACSLAHSNTHVTSGSPTTSCLFLSYTHALPHPAVNHSSWKSRMNNPCVCASWHLRQT